MINVLQDLNDKQIEAVKYHTGPLLVTAGPGTGKTTVITRRIAYLIRQYGVNPENILAITFTDNASQVMRDRLSNEKLIEEHKISEVKIFTFHSFCLNVLREHALKIGLSKNFMVCNDEIREEILTECLHELNLINLNTVSQRVQWLSQDISYFKARYDAQVPMSFLSSLKRTRSKYPEYVSNCENLFNAYQRKLEEQNLLDFDDLLLKTVELLENVPTVYETYNAEIQHVLVDEYQDVNNVQYRILQLVCTTLKQNLMVVADENQAIYGWRGADLQCIEKFKTDFNPEIIELDKHYRCSEIILKSAEKVIGKKSSGQKLITGKVNSVPESERPICHYKLRNSDKESKRIIWLLQKLISDEREGRRCSYKDIAILYRKHELVDTIVGKLLEADIKFQRVQPNNHLQNRNHIGIFSYLRFLERYILDHPETITNYDVLEDDLELAINFPQKRIDDLTWIWLKWLAQREGLELSVFLKNIEAYPEDVGPLTRQNVGQFWTEIERLSTEIRGEKINQKIQKILATLESFRSPYLYEDIGILEKQPEIPLLSTATDVLHKAILSSEPIQITTNHGIDEYCAAHIIRYTLNTYLKQDVSIQFIPHDTNTPLLSTNSVHILIGLFEDLSTNIVAAKTILIRDEPSKRTDLIQLETNSIQSITALKLCQHLLGRFENPNLPDLTIYDLETRGVNIENAEIVEIAAQRINVRTGNIRKYKQLVKPPGGYLPKSSTRVHEITEDMVTDSPRIVEVLPEFSKFIQNSILIGHNVIEFDNPILEHNLQNHLKTGLTNLSYDTLTTARRLYPRKSCSLEALADQFGIEHGQLHRAGEDVEVTQKVFLKLIKEDFQKRKIKSLAELLPFVGCAILEKTSGLSNIDTLTETNIFLNAATRFIQSNYKHDEFNLVETIPIKQEDKEQVTAFIDELQRREIPDSPEDINWKIHCTEFRNTVNRFKDKSKAELVSAFLNHQKQLKSIDDIEDESEQLTLMTLHSAKGTEFPIVIIIGIDEDTSQMEEEERRLFYVGMTRAKQGLYFTSISDLDSNNLSSSMFSEIPTNYIKRWIG